MTSYKCFLSLNNTKLVYESYMISETIFSICTSLQILSEAVFLVVCNPSMDKL